MRWRAFLARVLLSEIYDDVRVLQYAVLFRTVWPVAPRTIVVRDLSQIAGRSEGLTDCPERSVPDRGRSAVF